MIAPGTMPSQCTSTITLFVLHGKVHSGWKPLAQPSFPSLSSSQGENLRLQILNRTLLEGLGYFERPGSRNVYLAMIMHSIEMDVCDDCPVPTRTYIR